MIWFDFVIIGVILFSTLISLMHGFLKEAISLASWIIAFWVAISFSSTLEPMLPQLPEAVADISSLRMAFAFFLLFIGTLIIGAIVNMLVGLLVSGGGLTTTDRLLGMIFGLLRGNAIMVVAVLLVLLVGLDGHWRSQSTLSPLFESQARWLAEQLPGEIGEQIREQLRPAEQRAPSSPAKEALERGILGTQKGALG